MDNIAQLKPIHLLIAHKVLGPICKVLWTNMDVSLEITVCTTQEQEAHPLTVVWIVTQVINATQTVQILVTRLKELQYQRMKLAQALRCV